MSPGCLYFCAIRLFTVPLLSVFELLVQFRMPAVERNLSPVDEKVTHVGARFEQIATDHDEVGDESERRDGRKEES